MASAYSSVCGMMKMPQEAAALRELASMRETLNGIDAELSSTTDEEEGMILVFKGPGDRTERTSLLDRAMITGEEWPRFYGGTRGRRLIVRMVRQQPLRGRTDPGTGWTDYTQVEKHLREEVPFMKGDVVERMVARLIPMSTMRQSLSEVRHRGTADHQIRRW